MPCDPFWLFQTMYFMPSFLDSMMPLFSLKIITKRHPLLDQGIGFELGDFVYLRVSPTWGVQRFGIKGKLAPRYVGPFEIPEICGPVAYQPQLPSYLAAIHNVSHVSQLKKCISVSTEIVDTQSIDIESDLSYKEHPTRILDTKERSTRRATVKMYKIQWNHHTEEEAT
jgi:hypothetical protein